MTHACATSRSLLAGCPGPADAGLALAEGEVVAFIDDDVVVDPAWVRRCSEAFGRGPDVACVTGLILPLELETHSQLLLEQFAGFGKGFCRQTYRLEDARGSSPLALYTPGAIGSGANTALRADVARQLGGYDTSLGAGHRPPAARTSTSTYAYCARDTRRPTSRVPSSGTRIDKAGRSCRARCTDTASASAPCSRKQFVAGPERRQLLRALPAGIRYARQPASRKNAGNTSSYPRRLDWLERLGMVLGPAAYAASALLTMRGRLASNLRAQASDPLLRSAYSLTRGEPGLPLAMVQPRSAASPGQ
jgi:hypothetical protein